MRLIKFTLLFFICSAVAAQELSSQSDAPAPPEAAAWRVVKAVETTPVRGEIDLDGVWRFAPTPAKVMPEYGWGWISVPGSWRNERSIISRGQADWWTSFDRKSLRGGWYERDITVPAEWKGRSVLLDVARVSTDATVYLDGKSCGQIHWPDGTIDLGDAVVPGVMQRLRMHVVATLDKAEVMVLMGGLPGQTSVAKAELLTGGLTGSVRLLSRPRGPCIEDVFVRTSVRRNELGFDIEVNAPLPGPIAIEADVTESGLGSNDRNNVPHRFKATVVAKAAGLQSVSVSWPWANAKRWDVGQPNLYVAIISARGAGVFDSYSQSFGFRECWVEGRKIMLNGSEWRMRPQLFNAGPSGIWTIEGAREVLSRGHNFCEMWPNDTWYRSEQGHEAYYLVADKAGLPVNGVTPHMGWNGSNITSPARLATYRESCLRIMRRVRNHPSIVMWGTSGNMMGGALNPASVGQREAAYAEALKTTTTDYAGASLRAKAGVEIHRELDNTRPVFIHNGGSHGDIYALNNYLVAIPLQEREEWLSTYVKKGDMPLMYAEFGTPVSLDYMRGRKGFVLAAQSEPLFSEFLASELGVSAYKDESAEYRKVIREKFQKDQLYSWMHQQKEFFRLPAFLELQERFITNTWRSWRTMGITGGMIPWDDGYYALDGKITRAGIAMRASNGPTLAWICGDVKDEDNAAFTAKDHSFAVGSRVAKRVALLNDGRAPCEWTLAWQAVLAGREIDAGVDSGTLAVAQTHFAPLTFKVPAQLAHEKVDGEIIVKVRMGGSEHQDRFAFRAFSKQNQAKEEVLVYDPVGRTTAMLKQLGYRTKSWDGSGVSHQLLVVGRGAFTDHQKPPGDIRSFISRGGRAIIFAQDPHHVREMRGLRMSYKVSRRVFPVDAVHPAIAGLDAEDLRDWTGSGTMLESKPDYGTSSGPDVAISAATGKPAMGWRWGLRGSVATGALEKPHRAGWRPILECEFDLSYSPLMELDLGLGHLLWCQLDLEDHASLDPAASRLARQVLDYARTAPLAPRLSTTYLGGDLHAGLLDRLGVNYTRAAGLPKDGLAIIGSDSLIDRDALESFASSGGRVLVLPRSQPESGFGITLSMQEEHLGSLTRPEWPECRGLSASDLRARTESPAWIIIGGAEIGAEGMIGRRQMGKGVILFCQINPDRFEADKRTYLRLSRWRSTRALTQLLANLGASFAFDDRIFSERSPGASPDISLAGQWKGKLISRLPSAVGNDRHKDPGISQATRALLAADVDDSKWQEMKMPSILEKVGGDWFDADGETVLRRVIDVPVELSNQALLLELGVIDDTDVTYVNGIEVGSQSDSNAYVNKRKYVLPVGVIKPGRNVIAVRIWDNFGGGGFTGVASDLILRQVNARAAEATMYHPDYRNDWDLGDEPSRYYNW